MLCLGVLSDANSWCIRLRAISYRIALNSLPGYQRDQSYIIRCPRLHMLRLSSNVPSSLICSNLMMLRSRFAHGALVQGGSTTASTREATPAVVIGSLLHILAPWDSSILTFISIASTRLSKKMWPRGHLEGEPRRTSGTSIHTHNDASSLYRCTS